MTDQQEYDIFIIKFGNKVRELREDYSNLSDANKKRFEEMCQALFVTNGLSVTSDIVKGMLSQSR